jgi:hypothetical protein
MHHSGWVSEADVAAEAFVNFFALKANLKATPMNKRGQWWTAGGLIGGF